MKKLLCIALASCSLLTAKAATVSSVQIIHNCADAAADSVDVYLNGAKVLDNFAFRTHTSFISVPGDTTVILSISGKNSINDSLAIYRDTVTFLSSKKYIVIADGIASGSGYMPTATAAPLTFHIYNMARTAATLGTNTDALVFHGSTDAPIVDIKAATTTLVNNVAYGQFCATGYLSIPTNDLVIDVTDSSGSTVVKRYDAPLATYNLAGKSITVLASGFFSPAANSNGPAFGLWVADTSAGSLLPLTEIPLAVTTVHTDNEISIYPNPAATTLTIHTPSNTTISTVTVMDITGRICLTDNTNVISVSNLLSGTYFVKAILSNGASYTKQFVNN